MLSKTLNNNLKITLRPMVAGIGLLVMVFLWISLQYGSFSGFLRSRIRAWDRYTALAPSFRFEGFFDTSTVPQQILYADSTNWAVHQEGGRSFLAAADRGRPAIIHVRLRKDFDDYVIFPRVAANGAIVVSEGIPDNILFRLLGNSSWTPLGRRYLLNLRSLTGAESQKQFPLDLFFLLQGKNAQLWLSDGKVLFR